MAPVTTAAFRAVALAVFAAADDEDVVVEEEVVVAVAVAATAFPTDAVAARPHVCAAAALLCARANSGLWPRGPQSDELWQ